MRLYHLHYLIVEPYGSVFTVPSYVDGLIKPLIGSNPSRWRGRKIAGQTHQELTFRTKGGGDGLKIRSHQLKIEMNEHIE